MSARSAYTDPTTDQASLASPGANLSWMAADGVGKVTLLHVHEGASLSIQLKNTGANSITYVIYGTDDPTVVLADMDAVVTSATIASGASVFYKVAAPPYLYYAVQFQDTAGGSHGALKGRAAMKDAY